MFDLDPPQSTPKKRKKVEKRNSPKKVEKRNSPKKEIHRPVDDRPKKKKILTALLRSKKFGGGLLWEPYPSHHNGLFSPLLVLRDIAAREADQYRCYPNSTRLLTFSI